MWIVLNCKLFSHVKNKVLSKNKTDNFFLKSENASLNLYISITFSSTCVLISNVKVNEILGNAFVCKNHSLDKKKCDISLKKIKLWLHENCEIFSAFLLYVIKICIKTEFEDIKLSFKGKWQHDVMCNKKYVILYLKV